jgi:hypothetical protein
MLLSITQYKCSTLVAQPAGSSGAIPVVTPAPEGRRRVHFSPPAVTLGAASETRAFTHHQGHQSQTDSQADDPFVGPRGNIMADTHTQVLFYF